MIIVPFFRGLGFFNHQPVFWSLTARTMEPPGPVRTEERPCYVMISLTFWGCFPHFQFSFFFFQSLFSLVKHLNSFQLCCFEKELLCHINVDKIFIMTFIFYTSHAHIPCPSIWVCQLTARMLASMLFRSSLHVLSPMVVVLLVFSSSKTSPFLP